MSDQVGVRPIAPSRELTPSERARLRDLIAKTSPGGEYAQAAKERAASRERVLTEILKPAKRTR